MALQGGGLGGYRSMSQHKDALDDQMSTISKLSTTSSTLDRSAMVNAYRTKKEFYISQHRSSARSALPAISAAPNSNASTRSTRHGKGGGGIKVVKPGKHVKRLPATMCEKKRRMRERLERKTTRTQIEKWWEEAPTVAGQGCTNAQNRLSKAGNFTGVYRRRFVPTQLTAVSGDYCKTPLEAQEMLKSKSYQELNNPGRAADFRAEVEWRMDLRPGSRAMTLRHRLQQY